MKKQLPILRALSEDFIMNIVATLVSTGTMQLILYPQLAVNLGEVSYGTMLTVMGVINVITLAFGNNLAQTRLISEHKYKEGDEIGDFQIFLFVSCILSSLCVLLACCMINISASELLPIVVLTATTVLKSYYLVTFRLSIDYKKNLIANLIIGFGYIIASLVLLTFLHWSWAFTLSNVLCIIYICRVSGIVYEPFKVTGLFKESVRSYVMLIIGGLLSNLTTYLDRFVLYPILGAVSVSSFFVATYFSKAISLVFAPITSVLLSYFVQGRIQLTRSVFLWVNLAVIISSAVLIVFCITFGAWLTELLFPTLYDDVSSYIFLGSVGTVIGIACSFNNVVVLAVASPAWQTIIPSISMPVYLILSILLSSQFGLTGMCFALILSGALRFMMNFLVGIKALSDNK